MVRPLLCLLFCNLLLAACTVSSSAYHWHCTAPLPIFCDWARALHGLERPAPADQPEGEGAEP